MPVLVVFLVKGLLHKLKRLVKQRSVFGFGVAVVLAQLSEASVNGRVAELWTGLLSSCEETMSLSERIVLSVSNALKQELIVLTRRIQLEPLRLQCL